MTKTKHEQLLPLVYVRQMRPDEIPAEIHAERLFSIHDETGNRIGMAPQRDLAFIAARQHELRPVSVH